MHNLDELQLKQLIKSTVDEAYQEKQEEQSKIIAQSIVEYLKNNNSFDDEDHKLQHQWIKQQIEKEQKLQERYSDAKWKFFGGLAFFGFVSFVSAAGWSIIKFIEELIKNGGS